MSDAEIALVMTASTQPQYDREPVAGTGKSDLDMNEVARTLSRIRASAPRLAQQDDATLLCRIGATTGPENDALLTLAGLLTFGDFPQHYFPQLMVTIVVHDPDLESGVRFLDNQTVRGPIPDIVDTTLNVLRRNLATRAVITELGRIDEVEYPLETVREAIVNPLIHRDYSPTTRGTQVQVDLYPGRLVVRSPGGLYGGVQVDDLGEEGISSSRNATLASILSDTYLPRRNELVAENRASGIPSMLNAARRRGLPRPTFKRRVTDFTVTMSRSELLSPDVRAWIAKVHPHTRTPAHDHALAMLWDGYVTNEMLRQYGVDRVEAGRVLRELVDQGIAIREGSSRRYAQYVLDPTLGGNRQQYALFTNSPPTIETILRESEGATAAELVEATSLSRTAIHRRLRALVQSERIDAVGAPRNPRRHYVWKSNLEEKQ